MAESSVPVNLPDGFALINGGQSTRDISVSGENYFGTISQTWGEFPDYIVGTSVLFPKSAIINLTYNGITYFLIDESDVILSEQASVPEP